MRRAGLEARGPMTLASPSYAVPCSPSHEASRPRPVHPLHPDRRADRGQQPPASAACPVAAAASRRHAGLSPGDRHAAGGRAGRPGHGLVGRPSPSEARPRSERRGRPAGARGPAPARLRSVDGCCAGERARATRSEGDRAAGGSGLGRTLHTVRHARPLLVKILSAAEVDAALDDLALIDRLDGLFRAGCERPVRHHHSIAQPTGPGSADAMLLLMPAWTRGPKSHLGIKVVTVFPDNGRRSLPSIYGQYLLLDGTTGQTLALLDGTMLTKRRTACASGLASRYLSRPDSSRLLMIGTGALAPQLIRVHAKVRPIEEVAIWGRRPDQAATLARDLSASLPQALARPIAVRAVADRRQAVGEADIISCATLSSTPLVEGAWLCPGQHVDLVGAYTPKMRESDDEAVRRGAGRV